MNDSGADVGVVTIVAILAGLFGLGIGFLLTFLAIQVGVAPLRRAIDFRLGTLQMAIDKLTTQMGKVETAIVDSALAVVDGARAQEAHLAPPAEVAGKASPARQRGKRGQAPMAK